MFFGNIMNTNDLRHLNDEIKKTAGMGSLVGKLLKRQKLPVKKRVQKAGKDLFVSSGVVGAIGVGGFGYGAIKNKPPLSDRIMSRGQY